MFSYRRRRWLVMLVGLTMVAATATGCGLFGGDDEPEPQVVEPPATSQATEQPQATPAETAVQQEQETQPAEAVAVTTAPSEQEQEQQQATEPAAVEEEPTEAEPDTYVVQAGDTLAGIANQLGVRIDDLITLNGIQNPDVLHVGQVLLIPGEEEEPTAAAASDADAEDEGETEDESESADTPPIELPNVAVPAATPTLTSARQFPQPDTEVTLDSIPDPPSNFLQYGAAALPWLHGETTVDAVIELFKAWPMPALAVGHDRIYLIDSDGDQIFSLAIVYTNPNSFGAAVPYSNLVVYDPVPGRADRYRIAYDHALAYGREVQGIVQLGDADMTGDNIRDISFREITCNETGCVSSFYVLKSEGDGYRVYTGPDAIVADVGWAVLEDRSGDGAADVVVEGLATDEVEPSRYVFTFVAEAGELREALRVEASE